jgi:hypothetical protein
MLAPEASKILVQHLAHIPHCTQTTEAILSNCEKHPKLRIAITLVKAVHHCLRGRIRQKEAPPNNPNQHPQPRTIRTQPRLPNVTTWLSNPADLSQPKEI